MKPGLSELKDYYECVLSGRDLPQKMSGMHFIFGDKFCFIEGTILGIEYAPNRVLRLYISTPYFDGMKIAYLERRGLYQGEETEDEETWFAISPDHKYGERNNETEKEGAFGFIGTAE